MKILFIHHSTGGNLIQEGKLREEINKLNQNLEFWDHSYNLLPIFPKVFAKLSHAKGLSDAEGKYTGKDFDIVISNNSPKEYAEIFARQKDDLTLKSILDFDVIAFKNCFPTTHISSDEELQKKITYYNSVRDSVSRYPEKDFVLLTPPPLRLSMTNNENAIRAKGLVSWLTSQEFVKDTPNLSVFNFFALLSDENGFLRKEYERMLPWDSHPNSFANQTIAPIFAKHLVELIKK